MVGGTVEAVLRIPLPEHRIYYVPSASPYSAALYGVIRLLIFFLLHTYITTHTMFMITKSKSRDIQ